MGRRQVVRQWTLTPPFRGFKSFRPNHTSKKPLNKAVYFFLSPKNPRKNIKIYFSAILFNTDIARSSSLGYKWEYVLNVIFTLE